MTPATSRLFFCALPGIAALGTMLLASSTVHAAACLFRGEDASARVINSSGVPFTPFPDPLSDPGCERLRVVSGVVNVYVLDEARNQMQATRLTRGPLVPGGHASVGTAGADIFAAIQIVLQGGERTLKGSSRSDTDYIQTAMPSGRMAEPTRDLRIPVAPTPDENLKAVELTVGGKLVYRQAIPASEIVLPAAHLTRGSTVAWRVVYGPSSLTGDVEVVDPARLAELRGAAAQRSADEIDPVVRNLRIAASLAAERYLWDARQVVKTALQR